MLNYNQMVINYMANPMMGINNQKKLNKQKNDE